MQLKTLHLKIMTLTIVLSSLAGLSGCGQEQRTAPKSTAGGTTAAAPQAAEPFRLPVSLNEVMVALVNHSADPIWLAAWRNPESDKDWRNLERMAYQLQVAGALLVIPGNGPKDDEWTSNPQWAAWASQLEAAGRRRPAEIATATRCDIDLHVHCLPNQGGNVGTRG